MTDTTETTRGAAVAFAPLVRSPRRLILAGLGVACVGLGGLGVFVPGLPTTVFLILASYLFARSCPVLERRLLGARVFRPYVPYVRGERAMPRRARIAALATMWISVLASLVLLATRGRLAAWLATTIVAAAVAGSVAILAWRRARE